MEEEKKFYEEKKANDELINRQLDIISNNLNVIQSLTVDIGTELDIQNDILDATNDKITDTNEQFNSVNSNVKALIQRAGGCEFLVPCLIISAILLGLIGYIITITRQ